MPKKGKGKGKKGKKAAEALPKEPDIFDPEAFDESLKIVYVEYGMDCLEFKEKAQEIFQQLTVKFPDQNFKLVENRPRDGAFEIKMALNCRLPATELWSGIEREPRGEKFPDDLQPIFKNVEKLLKKSKN